MSTPLVMVLLAVCLTVSFLMSGMESGMLALNRLRLRQLRRAGQRRAELLHGYLEKPEEFLWTILVGNTLANFVVVVVLVVVLQRWLPEQPALFCLVFLLVLFGFYATCDLLPKLLFRRYPTRLCLRLAAPFRYLHLGLWPLVALMTALAQGLLRWSGGKTFSGRLFGSRDEMRQMMQEAAPDLSSEERAMINRVLDLPHVTVGQIATLLDKAVTVSAQTPMSEVFALWRDRQPSRLPVWRAEGDRRVILGLVSLKTVLYQPDLDLTKTAGDFVKPALYLDVDLRLEAALEQMQRSGQRLAIVLGRDRQEVGVISLQDVLKFLFSEVTL